MATPEVMADFNARTESGAVRMTTRGSQRDIEAHGLKAGDRVFLCDEELGAVADLVTEDGALVAVLVTEIFPLATEAGG